MNYIKWTFLICLIMLSVSLGAQTNTVTIGYLFKKVEQCYNDKEYMSYNSSYKMYANYNSKIVSEQYSGLIVKKNGVYYYKINDIEFLNFKDCSLKISNHEKAVILGKAASRSLSPLSLESYLKGFNRKLSEDKDYWICELSPSKVSQIMFHKIIIYINKKEFTIDKQIMYFLNEMPSKNNKGKETMERPRIEVIFSKRASQIAKDDLLVDKKQYLIHIGKKIVLSKRLEAYKLYQS
ncbi:MAG: hypothetical protein V4548_08030 [Bacteroidota bacterium]